MKSFFFKNWQHFTIISIMAIITFIYFSPQFDGYGLKQHDVEQFKGASNEIADYRSRTGNESFWTNSMFGGMPSTQISVLYEGNYLSEIMRSFFTLIPPPAGYVFIYMLGFYVLALCMGINPWVGLLGSLVFGFSSYNVILIQAGHNTKAFAIAMMAPVIGAFIMAIKRDLKWGVLLSAIFMTLQLSANHLQVSYYMGILLLFLGVYYLCAAIISKKIITFVKPVVGLFVAYALALSLNIGNLWLTNSYVKHTIRGANDLTINPDGSSSKENSTSGLDKDYITQWSYGISESFTLISPFVKGGGTVALSESPFSEEVSSMDLTADEVKNVMNVPVYWGDQPMTTGPVYIGIVVFVLALLGMVFVKNKVKWVLLGVTILTLALSWGKNFMGLTNLFLDYVPGYNKFRAVTIILIMVELCIPIIGILFLDLLIKERNLLTENRKKFLISASIIVLVLIMIKIVGLGDGYVSATDNQQKTAITTNIRSQLAGIDPAQLFQQYKVDINNSAQVDQFVSEQAAPYILGFESIKKVRESIFNSSMNRSILFTIITLGLLSLFFLTSVNAEIIIIGISLIALFDLIPISNIYLGNQEQGNGYKFWSEAGDSQFPIAAKESDYKILEDQTNRNPSIKSKLKIAEKEGTEKSLDLDLSGPSKRKVIDSYTFSCLNRNTNYRVFDFNEGFNGSRTSYFHKSLGGYHGAKLRNIQNLFDFQLSQSNNAMFDMLNVAYFIQNGSAQVNPSALGNAWFIKKIVAFQNPNDEIRSLGSSFELSNSSSGKLIVNGEITDKKRVFMSDKVTYLIQKDTIPVSLSNGIMEGMTVAFVMDLNGETSLVPLQTLQADTSKSFLKLVSIKNTESFDPKYEAVMLSTEFDKVNKSLFSGEGRISMTNYSPDKISYRSNSKTEQFAVFSEVFYRDGWKAKIDGKEVPIIKTNYLLRGLKVPPGSHSIEFIFDIPEYHTASLISKVGYLFLFIGIMFTFYVSKKRKKENLKE